MRSRPDILVLGAGGLLGEAWMSGVLAGMAESGRIDFTRCDYFVGTSAGAVIAAGLASGLPPSGPAVPGAAPPPPSESKRSPDPELLESIARLGADAATTFAGPWIRLGLSVSAPVGAFARATALRVLPTGSEPHEALRETLTVLNAEFDGRLRIAAVDSSSGRRVVFGSPGAPDASVADAVLASAAVPTRFAPHRTGGASFVDGAVWSPTNLDAAPAHRGAHVLCLSATASVHGPLNPVIRAGSRAITTLEVAAARSAGVEVELITPDGPSAAAIGLDPMASAPVEPALAAGYAQGLGL